VAGAGPDPPFGELLIRQGAIDEEERDRIDALAIERVDDAVAFAEASPYPAPESLYDDVYVLDQEVQGWYSVRTAGPQAPSPESLQGSSADEIPQQITSALQIGEDSR
jgi:hypothetical protein